MDLIDRFEEAEDFLKTNKAIGITVCDKFTVCTDMVEAKFVWAVMQNPDRWPCYASHI